MPHIAIIVVAATSGPLLGQDRLICDQLQLDKASEEYGIGLFHDALVTLEPCLRSDTDRDLRAAGFRLAAMSYLALDRPDEAESAVEQLLTLDPAYRINPESDNLVFQGMVEQHRPAWHTWVWRGNEWYKWAGRVALSSTIVAIPVVLINEEPPDLPEAPLDPR